MTSRARRLTPTLQELTGSVHGVLICIQAHLFVKSPCCDTKRCGGVNLGVVLNRCMPVHVRGVTLVRKDTGQRVHA